MSNKLYVGNLSFNISEDALTEKFLAFGEVNSCKIITDRDSGRSKGFGFIEMTSSNEAQEAIEALDNKELDGRALRVNIAKERTPRTETGSRW